MAGLPYMKFHFGHYFLDTGHLTCLQHGIYFQLIARYFTRGEALPDDDKYLANLVGLGPREWARHRQSVAAFFRVSDGVWFHRRIEDEIADAEAKVLQSKKASKASVERRRNGRSTGVERAVNHKEQEEESPSSLSDEGMRARAPVVKDDGKKGTKPKGPVEIAGEETIMRAVREDLRNLLPAGQYALFADPARPITFIAEEGRLVACCPDAVSHMTVRDLEYRLSQVAQEHGFSAAWIRERPIQLKEIEP